MGIGWNFPSNGNGQIRGFSDAGIETFGGDELKALAREICQNSLDAICEGENEVKVEFERHLIKTDEIPGYNEYVQVLNKCKDYWGMSNSEKANSYIKSAIKAINEKGSYVLRISDYNTTGLLGPYNDSFEGWNALTKIDGGANKNGDKGGSFGIGKNAPFCNSAYRLVFYRTLNDDGEIAAQGISRLLSFPKEANNIMNTMTTGIGYYGDSANNRPVNRIEALDTLSKRQHKGTDVFIYGFKVSGNDWVDEMCIEILDNFMMSIYKGKLSVKIQNYNLTAAYLPEFMERYKTKMKQGYCYYSVLSSNDGVKEFTSNFHSLGELKLRVLVDQNSKLNKKVLVTRTSGMKLFDLANIARNISFSAILEMHGENLNKYFREMETPSHDRWEPKRHSNPEEAKAYYEELKEWVRDKVISLGEYTSDEEIEVEGLSGILQNESETRKNRSSDDKKETLTNNFEEIKIVPRTTYQKVAKGTFYNSDGNGKSSTKTKEALGNVGKGGKDSAIRTLVGQRKRTKKELHKGSVDKDGKDKINKPIGGEENCPLENIRIMKVANNEYIVSFSTPYNIGEGHIEIVTVGENGKSNKLAIKQADGIVGCCNIAKGEQGITFSSMVGKERVKVKFSLVDNREYAMEVNVYANR